MRKPNPVVIRNRWVFEVKAIIKNVSTAIAAALFFATMGAAHAETDDDGGGWLSLNAQGKLPANGFNWHTDLQFRWRENGQEFEQFIVRPAVFYKLSERSSVWLGYANAHTRTFRSTTVEEHRIWQQFSYTDTIGAFTLQSRTRLEQRSFETGDDIGHRLRQTFRVSMRVAQAPKFSLIGSNEAFVNLNKTDWGARSGFDRNRLFLGVGYSAGAKLRLETGYLNQYVDTATTDRRNHVLLIGLNFTF